MAEYGSTWGTEQGFDFEVPSGSKVLLRVPDLEELLRAGLINVFDNLSPEVAQLIRQAQGGKPLSPEQAEKLVKDEKSFNELMKAINQVTLMAVMKPPIQPVPTDKEQRQPGVIYLDRIDIKDRIAIMNRVMVETNGDEEAGPTLADFRAEPEEAVGSVEPVTEAESPSE